MPSSSIHLHANQTTLYESMPNRRTCLAVSFITFGALVISAPAQEIPGPGLAVLAPQPAIAPGVESLPRVVAGPAVSVESAQRINAGLSQYDARMKFAARECIKPASPIGGEPTHDLYWKRAVRISMRGPRYLSLIASDDYDCGGVHPASGTLTLTYDLSDGQPVDWGSILGAGASWIHTRDEGGMEVELVRWPALKAIMLRKTDVSCRTILQDYDVSFFLWLDAQTKQLMASTSGLPEVAKPSCEPFGLSIPELRSLHVSPTLIDALAAARPANDRSAPRVK